jgi:hypothetical protein
MGRCAAAGLEKPEAYSLEYVEDFSWTENKADGRASFAAVEETMLDRLLSFVFFRAEMLEPRPLQHNPEIAIRERGHA